LASKTPVLALFAHPDDETFGPGGTLARLASDGQPLHLVCATRGEAGTIGRSAALGRRRLAELRERELAGACRALGLLPPQFLYLPDYGLGRLGAETLVRPFVRWIRAVRPSILITFHANGISGHLDHRTVTERAVAAFEAAGDPAYAPDLGPVHAPDRLWTYALTESRARRIDYRRVHSVPDAEIDALIDVSASIGAKRGAVAAHASQKPYIDDMEARLGDLAGFWTPEAFVLAAARTPLPSGTPRPVTDLFAGMNGRI
jgi:LmbE family N-acetylglucosaminyl deacetylase